MDGREPGRWLRVNGGGPGTRDLLGGVHEMPLGSTAYFTLVLEAGEYLWVSEQPTQESMFREFSVR